VLDELEILWEPPDAELQNLSGLKPPALLGEIGQDGAFVLEGSIVLGTAFSCEEYYRLSGSFHNEDSFTAQLEVVFAGAFCVDCEAQIFPELSGSRY
jgi:hypothetical protein